MLQRFNQLLDLISEFLAARKGLLPIVGILLILANMIFQFFPGSWLAETDLLLNLGAIVAILGFLLAWAL